MIRVLIEAPMQIGDKTLPASMMVQIIDGFIYATIKHECLKSFYLWHRNRLFASLVYGRVERNFREVIFHLISVIDGRATSCEIALRCLPLDFTDNKTILVQVMAWCRQAAVHYPGQCWLRWPDLWHHMEPLCHNELNNCLSPVCYQTGTRTNADINYHSNCEEQTTNDIWFKYKTFHWKKKTACGNFVCKMGAIFIQTPITITLFSDAQCRLANNNAMCFSYSHWKHMAVHSMTQGCVVFIR